MGRRKGSKNKKKKDVLNAEILREEFVDRSSVSSNSLGISILDLTEEVKERTIPMLIYDTNSNRTKGVEKRISSLVTRHRSFFLQTNILVEHYDYFIDSGGWAFTKKEDENTYSIIIGHVKNLLPFLAGQHPVWQQKRSYQRHNVRRGIRLG